MAFITKIKSESDKESETVENVDNNEQSEEVFEDEEDTHQTVNESLDTQIKNLTCELEKSSKRVSELTTENEKS